MVLSRSTWILLALAAAAGTVLANASVIVILSTGSSAERIVVAVLTALEGAAYIAAGIVARIRRAGNPTGWLMILTGYAFMWGGLEFAADGTVSTLGAVGAGALVPLLLWTVVGFPTATLRTAVERGIVVAGFATWVLTTLWFAFWPVEAGPCESCSTEVYPVPPDMPGSEALADTAIGVAAVLALAAAWVALRRARATAIASPPAALAPVGLAAAAIGVVLLVQLLSRTLVPAIEPAVALALFAIFMVAPVAFLLGVLRERLSLASRVAVLVDALGRPMSPGELAGALQRALGDPSVTLGFWLPERRAYVTSQGLPVETPEAGSGRAATFVERAGTPLAVLLHDTALLEDPQALDAVKSAASVELERLRLEAELRARLVDLQASRARVIEAADQARRRIERDLHDGAQQRFVATAIDLRLLSARAKRTQPELAGALDEVIDELQEALDDLRELGRGIHPAVLTDVGLGEALRGAASRAALPVEIVSVPEARLPEPIEAAVYFIALEALTNASRYANASRARIEVRLEDDAVCVEVCDDGSGGADPSRGTGLRGLADRVSALDGRLELESPLGGGTTIRATLPLPGRDGTGPDRGLSIVADPEDGATMAPWPAPS